MFATDITLAGPYRAPRQMLADQQIGGRPGLHEVETAATLGLAGAPIEGPTHFSQFDPLAVAIWGSSWFETGCISAHFQQMVIEGERVQASLTTGGSNRATIEAHKEDGSPVLAGSATIGPGHSATALDIRRAGMGHPGELHIVDQLRVGMQSPGDEHISMSYRQRNSAAYPFSLAEKLEKMTEPHPWYTPEGGQSSPWGRAIVPMEMISVLAFRSGTPWPVRSPSLGLFLDLEVRMLAGPIFVDHTYAVQRQVLALSQSRRTESFWTEAVISEPDTGSAGRISCAPQRCLQGVLPGLSA